MSRTIRSSLLILMASAPLLAQEDLGGRVSGLVTDLADRPVTGAAVNLVKPAGEGGVAASVISDAQGRGSHSGLAPGRWEVEVKAVNFRTSRGWFDVFEAGPRPLLRVTLRSLDEVTPIYGTGSQSISNWLEMGNDLLEQGYPERARQEYEKALAQLPVRSRPEVFRAVARTHYLEGDTPRALQVLEGTLVIDPADEISRKLLRSLAIEAGARLRVEEFLSRLDAGEEPGIEPPTIEVPNDPAADDPRLERLPIEEPRFGRTGFYRTRFRETSPLASQDRIIERLGADSISTESRDSATDRFHLPEESFHLYVPPGGSSSRRVRSRGLDQPFALRWCLA